MKKSAVYHEKKQLARAQHKAEKRKALKAEHRHKEIPRNQRLPVGKSSTMFELRNDPLAIIRRQITNSLRAA